MDKDNDLLRSERFMNVVKALNLSNMELEKKLGINRDLKSKISTGKQNASIDKIVALCEIYKVNANYILVGEGNMFLEDRIELNGLSTVDVEDFPSPETAEYWKRMYETTVVMYEAQFEDLQRRFNALNKSVEEIQDLFSVRRKAV